MKTCDGNIDLVIEKIGSKTIDWLSKNNVHMMRYTLESHGLIYTLTTTDFVLKVELINDDGSNLPESSKEKYK